MVTIGDLIHFTRRIGDLSMKKQCQRPQLHQERELDLGQNWENVLDTPNADPGDSMIA